jgi:hypothetical protein
MTASAALGLVSQLGLYPSPDFEASIAATSGESEAAKRYVDVLIASSRAASKVLAGRVDIPQKGLLRNMLVRLARISLSRAHFGRVALRPLRSACRTSSRVSRVETRPPKNHRQLRRTFWQNRYRRPAPLRRHLLGRPTHGGGLGLPSP